jgi:hypothetical protein
MRVKPMCWPHIVVKVRMPSRVPSSGALFQPHGVLRLSLIVSRCKAHLGPYRYFQDLPCVAIPIRICKKVPLAHLGRPEPQAILQRHRQEELRPAAATRPVSHVQQHDLPCTNPPNTLLPVCNSGCPPTILRNLSKPLRLSSITASSNRFRYTLPGSGGILTLALSRSSKSRKTSKSEYRRLTSDRRSLNAGMFVESRMRKVVYRLLGEAVGWWVCGSVTWVVLSALILYS